MSRFLEVYERCKKAAEEAGGEPFVLWPLTNEAYHMWKANAGNAKARRRWRRRNVPNTQRTEAISRAEAAFDKRLERELARGQRGIGTAAVLP